MVGLLYLGCLIQLAFIPFVFIQLLFNMVGFWGSFSDFFNGSFFLLLFFLLFYMIVF